MASGDKTWRCKWGCGKSFYSLHAAFIHERGKRCPVRKKQKQEAATKRARRKNQGRW